jgi:hypothetical protein
VPLDVPPLLVLAPALPPVPPSAPPSWQLGVWVHRLVRRSQASAVHGSWSSQSASATQHPADLVCEHWRAVGSQVSTVQGS